jgi:very-short-patch-repair endonuclease
MLSYNKSIKQLSRNPRRNMTKIIGNYIADFYCPKKKLVIEVDGGQHYSDDGKEKDCMRDDYMASVGINVMRFSDRDVLKNLDAVLEEIWRQL